MSNSYVRLDDRTPPYVDRTVTQLMLMTKSRRIRRIKTSVAMVAISVAASSPIHKLRTGVLKIFGASIADDVVLYHGFQVRNPKGLKIGRDSCIGDRAILDARGGLVIGESVNFSSEVQVWTAQHDWRSASFQSVDGAVSIGDRVWIGPRVIVLPGSSIPEGTVIAAGAVVRGSLESWSLYAGVPAKKIGDRPREMNYRIGGTSQKIWWW